MKICIFIQKLFSFIYIEKCFLLVNKEIYQLKVGNTYLLGGEKGCCVVVGKNGWDGKERR